MVNLDDMAPSPRQPLTRQGVLRISGSGQMLMTTKNNVYGTRILKTLRIGIENVVTLREKEEELIEVIKMRKMSIMALCEARARQNGDRIIHGGFSLIYSGGKQLRHGFAFLLEPSIAQFVEKVILVSERLIGVDLKLIEGVSITQVYASQQGRPTAEKDEYHQLQGLMDEMKYRRTFSYVEIFMVMWGVTE